MLGANEGISPSSTVGQMVQALADKEDAAITLETCYFHFCAKPIDTSKPNLKLSDYNINSGSYVHTIYMVWRLRGGVNYPVKVVNMKNKQEKVFRLDMTKPIQTLYDAVVDHWNGDKSTANLLINYTSLGSDNRILDPTKTLSTAIKAEDYQTMDDEGNDVILKDDKLPKKIGYKDDGVLQIPSRSGLAFTADMCGQCLSCFDTSDYSRVKLGCGCIMCVNCIYMKADSVKTRWKTSTAFQPLTCGTASHTPIDFPVWEHLSRYASAFNESDEKMAEMENDFTHNCMVGTIPGLRICPKSDCQAMYLLEDSILKQKPDYITCRTCKTTKFCKKCSKQWNDAADGCSDRSCGNTSEMPDMLIYSNYFKMYVPNQRKCPKCAVNAGMVQNCRHAKCGDTVSKNGVQGCGYQFCWVCGGDWASHNYNSCKLTLPPGWTGATEAPEQS